jgi:hypothetical protein
MVDGHTYQKNLNKKLTNEDMRDNLKILKEIVRQQGANFYILDKICALEEDLGINTPIEGTI